MIKTFPPTRQRGTAIIAVLMIAVLLSSLAAGAIAVTRVDARSAHARGESLKARAAAQSGLELAAYLLATGQAKQPIDSKKLPVALLNGYEITIAKSPETGKLDINLATETDFTTFFEFVGLETTSAQTLSARIADWRDADDLSRPNGAETRDYASAQNGKVIKNRPFHSIDELKLVLGFPVELHDCLGAVFTVFGTSGRPNQELLARVFQKETNEQFGRNTSQLGTASRVIQNGARHAVSVSAQKDDGRGETLTGLFRIVGGNEKPYEFIVVYSENWQKQNSISCS